MSPETAKCDCTGGKVHYLDCPAHDAGTCPWCSLSPPHSKPSDDPLRCPKSEFKDDRHAWRLLAAPDNLDFVAVVERCARCGLVHVLVTEVDSARQISDYRRFPEDTP